MSDGNNTYFEGTAEGMAPGHVYTTDAEARAALGIEGAPPMFEGLLPSALSRTATNEKARGSRPTLRPFDHDSRPGCEWATCVECGMTLDECMGFHLYVATALQVEGEPTPMQPGCMGTLCNECRVSDEDCAEYQDFLHSEGCGARPAMTAQALEIAGAHSPRCDY